MFYSKINQFVVVEGNLKPIIGLNSCEAMNLIQRVTVLSDDSSIDEVVVKEEYKEMDNVDIKIEVTQQNTKIYVSEYAKCFNEKLKNSCQDLLNVLMI